MNQAGKARRFAQLHVKGRPLVLSNIWDAGSARAVAASGAEAVATGSWSVAAAQGYADGEMLPLDLLLTTVRQIAAAVDLPVSVDVEGGYAAEPDVLADNIARLLQAGAIGINFEDRVVGGQGLYDVDRQCRRIEAIRARAQRRGVDLFINARTDLFLQAEDEERHRASLDEATARADAYRDAGASGLFVPGLVDEELIRAICAATPLPVNVMMTGRAPSIPRLAELGVARVSHGPGPYRDCMRHLQEIAAAALASLRAR